MPIVNTGRGIPTLYKIWGRGMQNAYSAYQEAQAQELDQSKLILMMYGGAIRFLDKAVEYGTGNKSRMGIYAGRAEKIILELMASLNLDDGGEMGGMLLKTYRALFIKLNVARLRDDMDSIREVRTCLAELESSWKQIFASPEYQEFKKNHERSRSRTARAE